MTLLSLLFALLIERVTTKTEAWRAEYHVERYVKWLDDNQWFTATSSALYLLLFCLLPAILTDIVAEIVGHGFLGLLFNTAILFLCLGCPHVRSAYKGFLHAANRGDAMACELHARALGHEHGQAVDADTFGQHLVWLNYTHYAAIVLFFALFGAAGAVFYVVAISLQKYAQQHFMENADDSGVEPVSTQQLMHWIDWLPVRMTALGFLLVGHFGRALTVWGGYLFDTQVCAKRLLCKVSNAAEDSDAGDKERGEDVYQWGSEPQLLVRLAKRNMVLIVMVISVLTLGGWL
ncbi:beta-lactamase regulator AmpE [Alteromonas facilis]|uniref:beta-lactamase regulator AmpE n=1 Tax=Alteromonas facilis TaxID=2048004 RepID=UPI000C28D38B|nr:beta-lactamase regulator AmpE [Alteromonas facilis]